MIIDTSVIIAILKKEDDFIRYVTIINQTTSPIRLSASSYVECCAVIFRHNNDKMLSEFKNFLIDYSIIIEPFTPAQAYIAEQAYERYGLGTGFPSVLNFGDCFAYALSKDKNLALLFKGDDFSKTDVRQAA